MVKSNRKRAVKMEIESLSFNDIENLEDGAEEGDKNWKDFLQLHSPKNLDQDLKSELDFTLKEKSRQLSEREKKILRLLEKTPEIQISSTLELSDAEEIEEPKISENELFWLTVEDMKDKHQCGKFLGEDKLVATPPHPEKKPGSRRRTLFKVVGIYSSVMVIIRFLPAATVTTGIGVSVVAPASYWVLIKITKVYGQQKEKISQNKWGTRFRSLSSKWVTKFKSLTKARSDNSPTEQSFDDSNDSS